MVFILVIMYIVCFDLEGVFTPEVWIAVSKATGIDDLKLTTRDVSDYDVLMKNRIAILKKNNITIKDIQEIISNMDLLPGAKEFLDYIRSVAQVVILTDSFVEFVMLFMKKLDFPMCFCHNLEINEEGIITDYKIRISEMKKKTVLAFKKLNYEVIAAGDSYNDVSMLLEANHGILFRPPKNVVEKFPEFPVVNEYDELKDLISKYLGFSD
ncbi:MAG TPA: bifunctional phosphoserine phosphatase/homoserine phosphotransferase ThrH [Candidatus Nanopelagicaceae bacterium]|nr:bifunctional phosphoserine phosphatase/homoserine phosphotransferase ThrH [Candidatus Nanopelagicaceae bacterium]